MAAYPSNSGQPGVRPQAGAVQPDASEQPLPRLVLHGLRHTWATLALHEGIDIKIVSERLNHSSTHVTREIYMHVTPPMQSDAAERVAARIFGPGAGLTTAWRRPCRIGASRLATCPP